MFDRVKTLFSSQQRRDDALSAWASAHRLSFQVTNGGQGMLVQGDVGGKPLELERGRATREYVLGDELRARVQLDLDDNIAVLVINRVLRDALEKAAYDQYTDTLQTSVNAPLTEEMRWIALYKEVEDLRWAPEFREFFCVLANDRQNALGWLTPGLRDELTAWPGAGLAPDQPFTLMLLRGKLYLRMQDHPGSASLLKRATTVVITAARAALDTFQR
jgi:hypothetical protein